MLSFANGRPGRIHYISFFHIFPSLKIDSFIPRENGCTQTNNGIRLNENRALSISKICVCVFFFFSICQRCDGQYMPFTFDTHIYSIVFIRIYSVCLFMIKKNDISREIFIDTFNEIRNERDIRSIECTWAINIHVINKATQHTMNAWLHKLMVDTKNIVHNNYTAALYSVIISRLDKWTFRKMFETCLFVYNLMRLGNDRPRNARMHDCMLLRGPIVTQLWLIINRKK